MYSFLIDGLNQCPVSLAILAQSSYSNVDFNNSFNGFLLSRSKTLFWLRHDARHDLRWTF